MPAMSFDVAKVLGTETFTSSESDAILEIAYLVGVANGTDALVIALRALRLAPGAEVLVPAFSFFATAEAVALVGGTPVFVDVDAETLNIDPADAARPDVPAACVHHTFGIVALSGMALIDTGPWAYGRAMYRYQLASPSPQTKAG